MTFYVEEEVALFPEKTGRSPEFSVRSVGEQVMAAVMTATDCPHEARVELLLTDNEGIREFNHEFRSVDSATDVLSFPGFYFDRPADFSRADRHAFDQDSGELMLGDIVISVEKIHMQADEYGHSIKREFAFLLVHGLLHLCGYDHVQPEEAVQMEARQEEILNKLAITRA